MNIYNVGRFFDHRIASVICFLLMFVKTIGVSLRLLPFLEKPDNINSIVFIKIIGFGSIILSTPAIRALKKKFPNATISIVTLGVNREVTELMNLFDEVITIDSSGGFLGTIKSCFSALARVRKIKPDVIFDLEIFSNLSSIFVFLCGPVFSVGFGSFKLYKDVFYNEKVAFDHSRHMIDIYFKLIDVLDVQKTDRKTNCFDYIPEKEHREIAENFSDLSFTENPIIFVNVNEGGLAWQRRMPMEKIKAILEATANLRADTKFVLIGGPSDQSHVGEFKNMLSQEVRKKTINLAGKTSFRKLLALFKYGTAFIGNDSGPLHLAVSIGLPSIAFFGPETPNLYGYDFPPHKMFYKNLFCSPCINSFKYKVSKCKKNVCLETIENEEVSKAIIETISDSFGENRLK